MEQRLIDADAIFDKVEANYRMSEGVQHECEREFLNLICDAPTVDAVPVGAVEQIRWERDIAMQQLQEHGIPFGGKADDVVKVCKCKDCKWCEYPATNSTKYGCRLFDRCVKSDWFCADGERRTDEHQRM